MSGTEQQQIVEARVAVVAWGVAFPQTAQPIGDLTVGHSWSPLVRVSDDSQVRQQLERLTTT